MRFDYPGPYVAQVIEAQVERTPDAAAVLFESTTLTYRELNDRANRLAWHMRGLGAGPETLVGVCLERSADLVVSLLAVLKSGAAYVPLDPTYPRDRLEAMLGDARPIAVLSRSESAGRLPAGAPVLCLDRAGEVLARERSDNPLVGVTGANLAYVIYTSGSTGQPKGAMNTHAGLLNRLDWMQDEYRLTADDCVLQKTPFTFDVSVWEFFWAFMAGARLAVARPGGHKDSAYLVKLIAEQQVTTLHFVPSMLEVFLQEPGLEACRGIKRIICSGEALPHNLQQRCFARLPAELHNLYGPTEAAIDVTAWPCSRDSTHTIVPIGRPIRNVRIHILDERLQPVPSGEAGELHIGGIAVGRGYLNRPELTAERFIADPFSTDPRDRLYKTGDLARWLSDGAIEYLGRLDHQVKIRGFRIELGEIESVLTQDAGVRSAVVVAREDQPGDKRLVAYVVPSGSDAESNRQQVDNTPLRRQIALGLVPRLRERLLARLPDYMIPSAFVVLDEFPLNANGKVDRKALPAPSNTRPESAGEYTAPRTPTEETLAGIWRDVLQLECVGIHDDFLELGGHSLLAAQVVAKIRDGFQIELPLASLFQAATVAGLADLVDAAATAPTSLRVPLVAGPHDRAPLSYQQEQMWLLAQLEPDKPVYNDLTIVQMPGALDVPALERSFTELLRRHESWRTVFAVEDGRPVQVVQPAVPFRLEVIDLEGLTPEARETEARARADADVRCPFDLSTGPLIRAYLVRFSAEDHRLYLSLHHIMAFGLAMNNVFLPELSALYRAFVAGNPSPLREPALQYGDFSIWQRQHFRDDVLAPHLAWWKKHLEGMSELQLPTDRPVTGAGAHRAARHMMHLPKPLVERLRSLSRREGVTPFMTLVAALKALLHRWTGQEDVTVATVVSQADRPELQSLLGFMINTVLLRTDLGGAPSFRDLLGRVRQVLLDAHAHRDLPFQRLVAALRPNRTVGQNPLYRVMFLHLQDAQAVPTGWTLNWMEVHHGMARSDLEFQFAEGADHFTIILDYSTELFDAATIERLTANYITVLEAITVAPETGIAGLPLLSAADRQQFDDWNHTGAEFPDVRVHQWFETQAARTPDAIAVEFAGEAWTYRELNERANRLAHRLLERGAGPGTLVGVCLERSADLVAVLLGVLKTGSAYVPLDPTYPRERLALMLADAQPAVVVTQSHVRPVLPDSIQTVCVDSEAIVGNFENPGIALTPNAAAYVLYTSGSTGAPKGVVIEHRSLVNFLHAMGKEPGLSADDTLLAVTTVSFDIHTLEIFLPLVTGARITLASRDDARDPMRLIRLLKTTGATVMQATPATWQALTAAGWVGDSAFKILCGGEALPIELAHRLRSGGAELWNLYGPTETTVWSTIQRVDAEGEDGVVSIGRPIANTHVHVLDSNRQLVPVGVPGELYIGGVGVARGYLNRSELTAERFLPDPFSNDDDARLYRTGDQVRRKADGTLHYLGRIDHQVKVRGFRIELGEIEAVLRKHPAVREAVVVAWPGTQQLAAYVVPQATVPTVRELRDALAQRLPDYMVPAAIVLLDRLPLTPNGKVDRKQLPLPQQVRNEDAHGYVEPRTATERRLSAIWSSVLEVERIGAHDNFLELGGSSLSAVRAIVRVRDEFGVQVPVRRMFENPTLAAFARLIEPDADAPTNDVVQDYAQEVVLDADVRPSAPLAAPNPEDRHIFLTGATGLLGAFLLHELLQRTDAVIHCLVRARSRADGERRLRTTLEKYDLWRPKFAVRLVAVPGDLDLPRLGLSPEDFDRLAKRVDSILHNGAQVNFVKSYSVLKAANVGGTHEILRLACTGPLKPVHYVSTVSVFGAIGYFTRQPLLHEGDDLNAVKPYLPLDIGYVQSKWVAEKLVWEAAARGVPVAVYRPGILLGHSKTGVTKPDDFISRFILGCIQVGSYPRLAEERIQLTPVDYAAAAIVQLALQPDSLDRAFHITPPPEHDLTVGDLFALIRRAGYRLTEVPYRAWLDAVSQASARTPDFPLAPLQAMFAEPAYEGLTNPEIYQYTPAYDCRNTRAGLAGTDVRFTPIGLRQVQASLAFYRKAELLMAPRVSLPNLAVPAAASLLPI